MGGGGGGGGVGEGRNKKGIHIHSLSERHSEESFTTAVALPSLVFPPLPSFSARTFEILITILRGERASEGEGEGREGGRMSGENGVSKHSRQLSIQGTQRKEGRTTAIVFSLSSLSLSLSLFPQLIAVVRSLVSLWRHSRCHRRPLALCRIPARHAPE